MSFCLSVKRVLRSPFTTSVLTTASLLLFEGCHKTPAIDPYSNPYDSTPSLAGRIGSVLIAILAGALFGAFFSDKGRKYHKYFWVAILASLALLALYAGAPFAYVVWFIAGFVTAYKLLKEVKEKAKQVKPTTFGSAEWASLADVQRLQSERLLGSDGLFLGLFDDGLTKTPLYYRGQRHLLTVAPTRAGKGTTAIVPNLLAYDGSVLVIDPKGENAKITALRRGDGDPARNIPGLGQKVFVVDPWGTTGLPVACFNPLDWLDPADVDLSENAMMLADSIVVQHGGSKDAFWDEEAKALLMGIILFVATDEGERETRTLGRVRDIIVLSDEKLEVLFGRMINSGNAIVRSTAARHASKDEKLRSNVTASLQSHTHFLDSPRIRESLSRSDFRFEDLKFSPMTVYLVLPADRLETFGRWFRLLVQQAITMNARNIEKEPAKPILFLLDEMAALGHLKMVEQAFGLMAGFGMQLWGIVQDVSQLEKIYDKGWETFVGNSGVLQYLGSRDQKTAEYFSKLCGVSTIKKTSFSSSIAQMISFGSGGGGTTHTTGHNIDDIQRPLAFPDELMVFRKDQALLLIENCNPISGKRVRWFDDPKLKALGVNLKPPAPWKPERSSWKP
jgi:type IV secretion system protein VirD4